MSGFPLLDPPHHLVEKIIRKVEPKSNYRLRQTCHDLYDLIKASPNIANIFIGGKYTIELKKDVSLKLSRHGYPSNFDNPFKIEGCRNTVPVDIQGYYGARLGLLFLEGRDAWNPLCQFLRKYRLTCYEMFFSDEQWTTEQWTALVKLLAPARIRCMSHNPSVLGQIFTCRTLKHVAVEIKEEDVIVAMETLLPLLPDVALSVDSSNDRFTLIRNVLQQLFSMPLQNLKNFHFWFHGPTMSREELEQEFPELHWVYKLEIDKHDTTEDISAVVKLPPQFRKGSSCKFAVETSQEGPWAVYIIHYQAEKSLP